MYAYSTDHIDSHTLSLMAPLLCMPTATDRETITLILGTRFCGDNVVDFRNITRPLKLAPSPPNLHTKQRTLSIGLTTPELHARRIRTKFTEHICPERVSGQHLCINRRPFCRHRFIRHHHHCRRRLASCSSAKYLGHTLHTHTPHWRAGQHIARTRTNKHTVP